MADPKAFIDRASTDADFKHCTDKVCLMCDDDEEAPPIFKPHIDGEIGEEIMLRERTRMRFIGKSADSFKKRYAVKPSIRHRGKAV